MVPKKQLKNTSLGQWGHWLMYTLLSDENGYFWNVGFEIGNLNILFYAPYFSVVSWKSQRNLFKRLISLPLVLSANHYIHVHNC